MMSRVVLSVSVLLLAGATARLPGTPSDPPTPARVTLRGQVVCSNCWDEADRKKTAYGTQADLKCAARCEKDAVPTALAVEEKNSFRLYILEDGAFRREGRGWLNYISKRVEATGTVRKEKGAARLKVDSLRLLSRDGK